MLPRTITSLVTRGIVRVAFVFVFEQLLARSMVSRCFGVRAHVAIRHLHHCARVRVFAACQIAEIEALYPDTQEFEMRMPSGMDPQRFRDMPPLSLDDSRQLAGTRNAPGTPIGKKNKQRQVPGLQASRPLTVVRPTVFRPGFWSPPAGCAPLPAGRSRQEALSISPALGLRPGVIASPRVLMAHRLGESIGRPEAGEPPYLLSSAHDVM